MAVRLAEALEISLEELAGVAGDPLDGTWWTARQVEVDGRVFVITAEARVKAARDAIALDGRGWRGELRRWPDGSLTGWYTDGSAQGTMYFTAAGVGRWVGTNAQGQITSGHAGLSRTREAAQALITGLTA